MSLDPALRERLDSIVRSDRVVLFMKGSPDAPQCGFSAQVVSILGRLLPTYGSFDVLSDREVREGIKEFSNWPTIPQLYVDGEFQGGCDIVKELYASGELQQLLGVQVARSRRAQGDRDRRRGGAAARRGAKSGRRAARRDRRVVQALALARSARGARDRGHEQRPHDPVRPRLGAARERARDRRGGLGRAEGAHGREPQRTARGAGEPAQRARAAGDHGVGPELPPVRRAHARGAPHRRASPTRRWSTRASPPRSRSCRRTR